MAFDWELQATQPVIVRARDYWQSRRHDRPMPTRADLDPASMRSFTEHVGLIEVRQGSEIDYFIRRAGTKWEAVFGSMTGRLIQEFLPPEIETRWRQVFDAVCRAKAPLRVTTDILFQGKSWLDAEMFLGPLGDGEVSMLFLAFTSWNRGSAE
ncbi:MAG TPA: PAS domain-containing protein [Rhizomicrobium sp.]|jgi:hypothetical protein